MFIGHPEAQCQFILTSHAVLKKNVVLNIQINTCIQCSAHVYIFKYNFLRMLICGNSMKPCVYGKNTASNLYVCIWAQESDTPPVMWGSSVICVDVLYVPEYMMTLHINSSLLPQSSIFRIISIHTMSSICKIIK